LNYKKSYLLLLLSLLAFFANGQQLKKGKNVAAWKISYALDFGSQQQKNAASNEDAPSLICYVSPEYIRVEQKGLGGGITLADKRDTVSYLLDATGKTATKYPAAMPNIQTSMAGDSMKVISSADFVMQLKAGTMQIAGHACKKAVFVNPHSPENVITVWYNPELPRLYWQQYSYLKSVPGCALAIGTLSRGVNIGIKANRIEKINLAESFFVPPADYTVNEEMSY
jgi:GLPGLI family protein